jgi:hypothetical protein
MRNHKQMPAIHNEVDLRLNLLGGGGRGLANEPRLSDLINWPD